MRIKKKSNFGQFAEGDMTPMIDMTFQLIAFFMVLVNFAQAEQNKRIALPISQLAEPPMETIKDSFTLHVDDQGRTIIFEGQEMKIDALPDALRNKVAELEASDSSKSPRDATVILRADRNAEFGFVQEVVVVCQKAQFEKFHLRTEYQHPSQ
jgi:biopolymer transport protein ExbD